MNPQSKQNSNKKYKDNPKFQESPQINLKPKTIYHQLQSVAISFGEHKDIFQNQSKYYPL